MTLFSAELETPVGVLAVITGSGGEVRRVLFPREDGWPKQTDGDVVVDHQRCRHVLAQLDEYFRSRRRRFELELELAGTEFQLAVWQELQRIPFGTTISYRELARRIGRPAAVRAVGMANSRNPIPIVVPCHRVIGADGSLTGFGGGLHIKRALLVHEGALLL